LAGFFGVFEPPPLLPPPDFFARDFDPPEPPFFPPLLLGAAAFFAGAFGFFAFGLDRAFFLPTLFLPKAAFFLLWSVPFLAVPPSLPCV
jgi:hypothetical protein